MATCRRVDTLRFDNEFQGGLALILVVDKLQVLQIYHRNNGTPAFVAKTERKIIVKKNKYLSMSVMTVIALAIGLAPAATGSSPGSPPSKADVTKALNTPTTLTYWGWDLSAAASVKAFQALHPAIKINYVNVGVGTAQMVKLRTALLAKSGVPDVVFMSADILPGFLQTNSILDLTTMGAESIKRQFVPAAWSPVALGKNVFGLPVGANSVASWYRGDLFISAGITSPPATWEEFAADAKLIKEKTGASIANFSPNDAAMMFNVFFQSGAKPFDWESGSSNVTIQLNSPAMKKAANFWNDLIQGGYVSTLPAWTDQFYQALNTGKLATWQAGIWGGAVMANNTKTSGKWKVSAWPQWAAGNQEAAVWTGGIDDVVMKASKNPIAAYEFIKFRATDKAFAIEKNSKFGWDPVLTSLLLDRTFLAKTDPFAGGQKVNSVFAKVLRGTGPAWHYPPFMEFVYASFTDTLGKAGVDRTSLSAGLDAWQAKVVEYAIQQGFKVN